MYWQKVLELTKFGIKPGLERITAVLEKLGNPQLQYRTIHVAGTNGKGSTSYLIAKALEAAGHTAGLYTSPHLTRFNERIKINGENIGMNELEDVAKCVLDAGGATFFEATTAIAFLHFARQNADIAVVEVGLGGTWDATNVVKPDLCVITNVGRDHEDILGKTTQERAREKAGIIKKGSTVIIGEQKPEVVALLLDICKKRNATPLLVAEQDTPTLTPLQGDYQKLNAKTAYVALRQLGVSEETISDGWRDANWPGRMDQRGNILLDGAHNPDGIEALAKWLKKQNKQPTLVIGIKQGKAANDMLAPLAALARKIILTQAEHAPTPAQELYEIAKRHCANVVVCPDVADALKMAENEDFVVVTGSLYLVGDALRALSPNPSP